jgi:hypothetical protein
MNDHLARLLPIRSGGGHHVLDFLERLSGVMYVPRLDSPTFIASH